MSVHDRNEDGMLPATLRNMTEHASGSAFAWSPITGEEYSATPGDYFTMGPNDVLRDSNGDVMYLATRHTSISPV